MKAEYNHQIIIDNIITLIQNNGLKVGLVEKELCVSPGYLSRLSKKENKTTLGAEFVWKASHFFGVSMDFLVRSHINEDEKTVAYMRKFVHRLIERTNDGKLEWKAIHVDDINNMLQEETHMAFPVITIPGANFPRTAPCKATDPIRLDDALGCWGSNKVLSCIYGGAMVNPQGTVYHVSIPYGENDARDLYLACYCTETEAGPQEFFELMMLDNNRLNEFLHSQDQDEHRQVIGKSEIPPYVEGVCNTYANAWYPITPEMQELYQTVSAHEKEIVLSNSVIGFIDSFMSTPDQLHDTTNIADKEGKE